jgi:phage baseplate assembly protein W
MVKSLYSDVNQYTPESVPLLTDVKSIYQSVHNIVSTRKGERLFNVEVGVDIDNELFEVMDIDSADQIYSELVTAIESQEPRVSVVQQQSSITPDYDNHCYEVLLYLEIVGKENEGFQFEGKLKG